MRLKYNDFLIIASNNAGVIERQFSRIYCSIYTAATY